VPQSNPSIRLATLFIKSITSFNPKSPFVAGTTDTGRDGCSCTSHGSSSFFELADDDGDLDESFVTVNCNVNDGWGVGMWKRVPFRL
jgi:Cdc6-like AAA superfamily ATPase